jgi:TonB family protein
MKLYVVLLVFVLSAAAAQDSSPIVLGENTRVCNARESDERDCVTAPRTIYAPDPQYPEKERKARHRGTVVVELVVDTEGSTRNVTVIRPLGRDFDQAAVDAVRNWKFSPATRDGQPVAVRIKVEVSFRLY